MKLLFISRDFPNIFGGVSDYTYNLSRALAEKSKKVYVLTSKDERVIKEDKGFVKILPVVKVWGFRGLPGIFREIKKINPDWILLQYVPHMYNYYAMPIYIAFLAIILRLFNYHLLVTFHEVAIRFDIRKPKYWGIAIIERIIAYILCITSKKVVVSIEFYRKMLCLFSKKIIRIPVGSNILQVNCGKKEKIKLRNIICPNGEYVITSFGAGASWRRNDIILEAASEVKKRYGVPLKLVFLGGIGNSNQKDVIQSLSTKLGLEKDLVFTGFIEKEKIYEYLAASDIFIFLDADAYGGVSTKSCSLAAAYAAGLPIIANKGILTDDFFKDKKNILLIGGLNKEEVVRAIIELLNDRSLINELRKGSLATYRNFLSWDKIAEQYRIILNDVH